MIDYLSSPEIALPLLLIGLGCILWSLSSWIAGFQLLVIAIVFGGIVGARFGNTALPIVFRDALIVLPLYASFLFSTAGGELLARLPAWLALGLAAVLGWVVISLLNPNGASGLQLLIGVKVWLFYVPFVLVGIALAGRRDLMFRTFRVVLICGLVTCAFGLMQAVLIRVIGYHAAMTLFFGNAASAVTQRFAEFSEGGGIYRIPGTFSFAGQYVTFLFLFLVIAAVEANADPSPRYQRVGRIALYVGMLAGLLSGTKAAFLIFPALGAAFFAFGLIRGRLIVGAPIAFTVGAFAVSAAGLDPLGLASYGARLARGYSEGFIFTQIGDAVRFGPFGQGIGSSTGAARFAALGVADVHRLGFESYYAKIAAELGTIGLAIFGIFFIGVVTKTVWISVKHRRMRDNLLIAPFAIYIVLNLVYSFKGFVIDTDPGNVFFWLILGMMIGLDREAHVARSADRSVLSQEQSIAIAQGRRDQALGSR